ncbi:LCP family protein [Oscillatoria acuminata]|uniref:Transcriptional attenuator, LytR family n=1 Tax=Oscillatoria acuminata PCC 6304 TaxID=56110 RepID=K9TMY1_9CYAN|nr:LCP family protein [Oscillatoria acuminata]AFY83900.1 transcriptional attenuator, LytR family [Oscillatoria acuminata PCC 6304]
MLEVIELYNNLPIPPQKPKKKSPPSKRNRFNRASKISIPPLPLPLRLARVLLGSFTLLLMATLSLTLGAIVAVFDAKVTDTVPDWQQPLVQTDSPWPSPRLSRSLNLLVLGIEGSVTPTLDGQSSLPKPAETLWLMRFDPVQNAVSVLLIPPQTRVQIPDRGRNPVASAHSIGGVTLTSRVLSQTLNAIPIDRYIRADAATFRSLIDWLGGVELFVPESLSYQDSTQGIAVNLQPGWQTLKGEETLGFARFQKTEADRSGLHRQQMILQSLGDRLASPTLGPQLPRILQLMHEYIDTNLTREELFGLVTLLQQRPSNGLKMVLLPGEFTTTRSVPSPYWNIDTTGRDRVLYHYFDQELNSRTQRDRATTPKSPKTLKVALQNASGNPLILGQILAELKSRGYRNVYPISDWPDLQRHTQIIIQTGDIPAATTLQNLLPTAQIQSSSLGDLESEITIRIGEDALNSKYLYWAK